MDDKLEGFCETRLHRVLIRINSVDVENQHINITIPSWSPFEEFNIDSDTLGIEISSELEEVDYLLGFVNIGAKISDDLIFRDVTILENEDIEL